MCMVRLPDGVDDCGRHDDDLFADYEGVDLAPAVCRFCGEVTSEGLMVFPNAHDVWPVCVACMQAAMARNPRRFELRYRRSPN